MNKIKLGEIANITKLAGFEHTKFIQGNCTHSKVNVDDIPLFIGKTVRNGKIDNNFDWYIPKSISEELPRSQLRKKCIICPYVGSLGDLAIFEGKYEAHLGSNIAKIELVDNKKYTEEFLYYYLKSPYGNSLLLKDTQGAVQKNITMEAIRNVILPNIDYKLQSKISSILKFLDDKIELNNKINSELEAMAKTIYDYWFLQFEFPNEEGKPYKSSGGKMVWNDELKREIPEIFQNLLLKEIKNISVITGKTPSTKDETNFGNEVPFITIEDLRENVFVVNTKRKLSKKGANAQEKKYIPSGSICVSCIATIGEIAITTETSQTNQQINSVICGREEIRNYLYFYLKNIFLNFKVKSGNIFSNMNKEEFESVKILLPTENILVKFSKIISLILSKIEVNTKENQELTSLRDFLLPLLMNGQVGFKEE